MPLWSFPMRIYCSETDYPIVLTAVREANCIAITPVAQALRANGIRWPEQFAMSREPDAIAIDHDICRAWQEVGLRNIL